MLPLLTHASLDLGNGALRTVSQRPAFLNGRFVTTRFFGKSSELGGMTARLPNLSFAEAVLAGMTMSITFCVSSPSQGQLPETLARRNAAIHAAEADPVVK